MASVEVAGKHGWQPLDPAMIYTVASNNFMRAGGDGYVELADGQGTSRDKLDAVLGDYLKAADEMMKRAQAW